VALSIERGHGYSGPFARGGGDGPLVRGVCDDALLLVDTFAYYVLKEFLVDYKKIMKTPGVAEQGGPNGRLCAKGCIGPFARGGGDGPLIRGVCNDALLLVDTFAYYVLKEFLADYEKIVKPPCVAEQGGPNGRPCAKSELLFQANDVNDYVTKSTPDHVYGCCALPDDIARATDVKIEDKLYGRSPDIVEKMGATDVLYQIKSLIVRRCRDKIKADGDDQLKVNDAMRGPRKTGIVDNLSPDVAENMGYKDALHEITCLVIGRVDTVAYYTTEEVKANIKKTMMVQPRGIKPTRGSLYLLDIRIIKSKAGYYRAAFDEHDVYDIIRPASALPMKRAVMMKAMTAEMAGEAMKTTYVGKLAKVEVKDVFGIIGDMIAKLAAEANSEATEKAYYDEQMAKTQAKKSGLDDAIAKMTEKVDQATAKSAELKDRIAVNNGDDTAPLTAAPMMDGIAVSAFVQIRE
jgi:hypothetical protein